MTDEVPHFIQEVEADDDKVDVTREYEDAVDMFLTLAESRSLSVPMKHAVVYEDEDLQGIVFRFVVDVDRGVLDTNYGFDVATDTDVADALSSDSDDQEVAERVEMAIDQFNRQLRTTQEAIWEAAVNT